MPDPSLPAPPRTTPSHRSSKAGREQEQLDRIEAKLDQVLEFRDQLQALLRTYLGGGKGKLLAALLRGGGG